MEDTRRGTRHWRRARKGCQLIALDPPGRHLAFGRGEEIHAREQGMLNPVRGMRMWRPKDGAGKKDGRTLRKDVGTAMRQRLRATRRLSRPPVS